MSYVTPPTWIVNEVLTSADLNTLSGDIVALRETPSMVATMAAVPPSWTVASLGVTGPPSGFFTQSATAGGLVLVSGSTCTIGVAGIYHIDVGLFSQGLGTTGQMRVGIGSGSVSSPTILRETGGQMNNLIASISADLAFGATDIVFPICKNTTNTTATVQNTDPTFNWFNIHWVAPQ